jgi:hypothetical protein
MAKVDYNKYLVRKPACEADVQSVSCHRVHRVTSMTCMSNALVPGRNPEI